MTQIATTIAKRDSCPDVIVDNTTDYPANTSHDVSNFSQFVRYTLNLPNGTSVTFSTNQYPNQVLPPAQSLSVSYSTCQTGKFTATYMALPTPPESEVEGQSNEYTSGDNFYYNGHIYNVIAASIGIPADGFTNEQLIAAFLEGRLIEEITEDEIDEKYKAEIDFTSWCTLETCLKDKLAKLNCLIVDEPTRMDICEMELYEEIIQLNFVKYIVDNILVNPYVSSVEEDYKIKSLSNYVNSICCSCKKCDF